ncbi:MAG: outer membrane lipoprotein carrier protein LolA [Bacteroidales bacterium]|nr:outer membrane lipoprotein carrier protein LolA [Bacteroidales bacterium]
MKKILFVLMACVLSFVTVQAQDAELQQKALELFKNTQTVEAKAKMTKHNTMVTKDVVSEGKLYFKRPNKLCMTFNNGADALIMNGETFTMVTNGKAQSVSGKGNGQFDALKGIAQSLSQGGEAEFDLSDVADVDIERKGNLMVMTIVPIVADAKAKRKQLFQSYVITIDTKALELRTLRMNEKGQNYTQYDFSGYKLNGPIDDKVFSVK